MTINFMYIVNKLKFFRKQNISNEIQKTLLPKNAKFAIRSCHNRIKIKPVNTYVLAAFSSILLNQQTSELRHRFFNLKPYNRNRLLSALLVLVKQIQSFIT